MDRQGMKDLYYGHSESISDCISRASDCAWRAQGYFLDFREPMANLVHAEQSLEMALGLVRTLKKAQADWDAENG